MPPEAQKSVDYRVKAIFSDILMLEGPITDERLIYTELGADSLDLVEICAAIHAEFGFEAEEDAAEKWRTIGDVIRYVRSKLPPTFTQADVDVIVARAKELGASDGLTHKYGHLRLPSYVESHSPEALARLIVNGWGGTYDLTYATQALIEFLATDSHG